MATLKLGSASQTVNGTTVNWSNIATELTEDGSHAFSDFYNPGSALAPMSFSYEGEPLDVQAGRYSVGASWNSTIDFARVHRTLDAGAYVLSASTTDYGGSTTSLSLIDPATMTTTDTITVAGKKQVPVTADASTGTVYVYNPDHNVVDVYSASTGKLVKVRAPALGVGTDQTVLALGFNPASKTVALYSVDSGEGTARMSFAHADGTVSVRDLPAAETVSARLAAAGSLANGTEYFGDSWSSAGLVLEPLADGTFLFNPGTSIYNEMEDKVLGGHLLHLADSATAPVTEVAAAFPADGSVPELNLKNLKTASNGLVYRWNGFYGSSSAFQVLCYENGNFTRVKDYTNTPSALDGTSEVAAMFWDGERTALLDTYRGRIVWLNDDFTVADTLSVPNMAETAQNSNAHTAVLANGDIIMPTMIEDANYNEHHYLTRIVKRVVEVAEEDESKDPVLKSFRDVPVIHPFYREITWLANRGITTGWEDGTFRPEASTQRAAMAAFIYRYIYRYTAWKNNS